MTEKVIAVDIGGTESIVAVIDTDYKIHDRVKFETSHEFNIVVERIRTEIEKFDPERKLSVGIAICGLLSLDGKRLLIAPNLGWRNLNIHESFGWLERDFIVVNDGTAAAWASYITEIPGNIKNLLAITLGTGVGGGIVSNDSLLIGAGELGHIKVDINGPLCNCGKQGCLETFVGGKHIPDRAREWYELNIKSPKELFELAEGGNLKALNCWKKIGNILGYALSSVVNLNGTQVITIGGKISRTQKYFLKELKSSLNNNLMVGEFQNCEVFISKWKHNFSLIGAASSIIKSPGKSLL